jgi:hypothetical protein
MKAIITKYHGPTNTYSSGPNSNPSGARRETRREGKPMPHKLRIISTHDAQAVCLCGRWTFTAPGERTREHIAEEWRRHAAPYKPNAKRANKARTMLRATYQHHPTRLVPEDVTDALTDIRHLCDERGFDFFALETSSYQHYLAEKGKP